MLLIVLFINRSIEASQKLKNITIKTLDSTITSKTEAGTTQLSSKCADINQEMFNCLGVSRPILNYVIFCHQEDSNWPLDEGSKVKEKFDEIFNSVKYQKCLKNIKEVRKSQMDNAKMEKNNMEHYKSDKDYAENKGNELKRKKEDLERLQESIGNINEELKPIVEAINEVAEEEKGFGEIQKKLAEAQTSFDHVKKERDSLEKQISEIIPESVDEVEIERKKNGIEKETRAKENEMKVLTEEIAGLDENLSKGEKAVQKNAAHIGKAVEENSQHLKNVQERLNLIETTSDELGLVDDDDFSSVLEKEEKKIDNQINLLRVKNKENENKINDEIDSLKSKKTGLEERKKRDQADRIGFNKEMAILKRQLNDLDGAAEKLVKIKRDWEEAGAKLEEEKSRYDLKSLSEEIDREKQTIKELEIEENKIKEERKTLDEKQSFLQRISHLDEDLNLKQSKIDKLMTKRNDEFLQLFDVVPDTKRLKNLWKNNEEMTDKKMKELESARANLEAEINSKKSSRREAMKIKDQKQSRKQNLEGKIGEILGPDEDLEEELVKTQESLELNRKELQVKEAGKFTYREMIERMKKMEPTCPACPTCNRAFIKSEEATELISDLEDLIKSIPGKVKSLESKVKNLQSRQEQLQRIRPEAHELTNLKKEVEVNTKKIEELDGDLKSLKKRLDDGEEDLSITEVSASLLKQVSEDVQQIDNLTKEVASLNEKKEELSLQVDGGVGRNIEDVRKEEEDVCQKIKVARKNLDQCQETVSTQSSLINDLEAKKNKLTERKLEIEGQQQQRSNMMEKKEELESKVSKAAAEIQKCDQELEPVKDELEEMETKKRKCVQEGEHELNKLLGKHKKVEQHIFTLQQLEEKIRKYIEEGKENEVKTLKEKKDELDEQIKSIREDKKEIEEKMSNLKVEVSNQESRRRMYDDNIRLREYKTKEDRFKRQIQKQSTELEERDWARVMKKKDSLHKKYSQMSAEKNAKEGQVAEVQRSIREVERDLNQPKLKNAANKYKEMAVKHKLRLKVAEDLDKYYRALDYAIMKYHKEKMKVINKIIRELWKNTYKGNDIDYIEIKTTEDNEVSAGADKRKTYAYRVVMIKNEAELDMRGRCSAGQKVLASLIIRLALAETFSANCGIIALDEPTTNLDRENIESLANALTEIVNKRAAQRNFQLVVITHDEEFIELLSRCDQIQYYQEVSRNSRGLTEVRKRPVNALEV